MAENIQTSSSGKPGASNKKSNKHPIRVDLTPMVDLGFILITFFIFTTTMSESKAMRLVVPSDVVDNPSKHPESKTMTFIMDKDESFYFYPGSSVDKSEPVNIRKVRTLIMEKKSAMQSLPDGSKDLLVLIKPTREASYKSIMALLDEMLINEVGKYMIVEPGEVELQRLGIRSNY